MSHDSAGAPDLFAALPEGEVGAALLPYLREATAVPGLVYAEPPAQITGGFDTFIYGFAVRGSPEHAGRLILRVYRDERGPEKARFETLVQNAIADFGFPTPRVVFTCIDRGVLGGAFQIMRRLPGVPMGSPMFRPGVQRLPSVLAALQLRLHGLDREQLRRRLEAADVSVEQLSARATLARMRAQAAQAQLDGLQPGLDWLARNAPEPTQTVICHGDFHPLNVMLDDGNASGVLDWTRVAIEDPAFDVGATVAIMTQAPLRLPPALSPVINAVRRWLVGLYLRAYRRERPLDEAALRYYEAFRCTGFLLEVGEKRRAEAGVIAPIAKPTAFNDTRVIASICARFRNIAGVGVALPH